MNCPIGVSNICVANRKQTSFFSIAGLMLAITPLWLMLAAANTSAHAQTTSSPADWTQFLRDNMQRWNPYETVLGVNNVSGLKLKWAFSTGNEVLSSPAVANGVVYVASVFPESSLYAVNASTGALLWSYPIEVPPIGTPAIISSPAVANGVVYFGSIDHNVYALNASTGVKLWSFATGNIVFSSPAVANGVVYVGSADGNVYALNAGTGAKLWSSTFGGGQGSPAVVNGVVYIGSDNVYALNATTGAKLWTFTTAPYSVESSPAVANGVVYIGAFDGTVYALNASTGVKLWSYTTGNYVASAPAVANTVVYISSQDGNVYALNAGTGAKLWSYAVGATDSSPAVANGVVYINSDALNASTGAKLWSYPLPANSTAPAIVDGVVYITDTDGNVSAFSLGGLGSADLFLRIQPTPTTVHQGDLLTYAFPVWNLGPDDAVHEVLNTQVPAGTTFDYVRISGTPGLGTCTTPPYQGTGQIVCHENASMAPNTTWTVRVTVKVTAPSGTVITENAATMADTPDPNMANNTASVSTTVQ